jgi:hypothetical protein
MKKLIFILFGLVLTTSAMSQTEADKAHADKKKDEKKLENTITAKNEEKHKEGNDLKHLKVRSAARHHKVVRADNRKIHRRASHLKTTHRVKHPIHMAKKELKENKDKKKENF